MPITKGKNCKLGKFKIKEGYGEIVIGDNVIIDDDVLLNVTEYLEIGDRSIISKDAEISGKNIVIGKEFWMGKYAQIGGGSCFENLSELTIGDMCHLGNFGSINTAREVKIGDEVGLGEQTKLYTHGVFNNFLTGAPAKFGEINIGNRVWCPCATILPSVTIGSDVVVGVNSLVNKSLPSGCLAFGTPAKVIKENCFPKEFSSKELSGMVSQFLLHFLQNIAPIATKKIEQVDTNLFIDNGHNLTLFDLKDKKIDGRATELTERLKNELRRWGIRFKYYNKDGVYIPW